MVTMRADDVAAEISFYGSKVLSRRRLSEKTDQVLVRQHSEDFGNSCSGVLSVPPGIFALVLNQQGSLVVRRLGESGVMVLAPGSVTFVPPSTDLLIHATKGVHQLSTVCWFIGQTPTLMPMVMQTTRKIASRPMEASISEAIKTLTVAENIQPIFAESLFISAILKIVTELMMMPNSIQLACIPTDLSPALSDLVERVINTPSSAWPLKEAADIAGYSPFHFSRVFKSTVGTGFHEFVDRNRTSLATHLLANTDATVDDIAMRSGFGTTQGLRDSMKEYLGLLPSEIRNVPLMIPQNLQKDITLA